MLLNEVRKAQDGDSSAMINICCRFEGLIKKYAYKSYLKTITEEALAEGYLALMEAVKTFDADKGINFAGYVDSKIKFAIWNLFKKYKQKWEKEESLDQEINDISKLELVSADDNIEEAVAQKIISEKLKDEILNLPKKQQEVLILNMVGEYSLTQIGQFWNISPQAVFNIKKRALQNLQKSLVL